MRNKSIYERSFRPFASAPQIYAENLSYRLQRGLVERSHHPLDWPDDSSDSEASTAEDHTLRDTTTIKCDMQSLSLNPESYSIDNTIVNNANTSQITMCDGS